MKEIIINEKNVEKLKEAIDNGNGKASVRTIGVQDVLESIKHIDDRLVGVSKKNREGLKVHVQIHAQTFPNAYKYTPYATSFCVWYHNRQWRLIEVHRTVCRDRKYVAVLPDALKVEISALAESLEGIHG